VSVSSRKAKQSQKRPLNDLHVGSLDFTGVLAYPAGKIIPKKIPLEMSWHQHQEKDL
jgi:hypothetical protein